MELLIPLICISMIFWIVWRRKRLRIFEELNIPGPPPNFFFGNMLEINSKGLLECQEEWTKKYGQIVGYFHGLNPVLLISDHNILKRIFIKDFQLFSERPEVVPLRVHSFLDSIIPASQIMDSLLLNLKGEEWKRVRSKLSPAFSTNKLKMMISFVDKVSEVTSSILEKKALCGEIADIYSLFQCLTLDVICAQAFGLDTNVQSGGENNLLFRSAKTIFDNSLDSKIIMFGLCFPELGFFGMAMNFLKMFFANGFSIPPLKITNTVGKAIEERRKHPEMKRSDLLQSLIDVSNPESMYDDKSNQAKDIDSDEVKNWSSRDSLYGKERLTDLEIKSSALIVFLAGFETTSSSLAYTVYMLAKYPQIQAKIQNEVDQFVENKELDYYILKHLQLLDRFMLETMRFYPPAINSVLRIATEDVNYGSVKIPKGMLITVPITYIHFNEEIWENPTVFDPDRFLTERRISNLATSYWAFGSGPRSCLGARLANITSKVILTKFLQRYTFELPQNSDEESLSLIVKWGTMVPEKVLVKVKRREVLKNKEENQ